MHGGLKRLSGNGKRLFEIGRNQREKLQKYDECLEYCRKARELAPYTHPPKVLLAVFCTAGNKELAFQMFQEARAEEPNYPVIPMMLGQMAMAQQDRKIAQAAI